MYNNSPLKEKAHTVFQLIHERIESGSPVNNYLLSGKLGLVLYYFSLYEAFDDADAANKSIELLEEIMNPEEGEPAPLSGTGFANGTSGLGYVLALLQNAELIEVNLQEDLHELDESMAIAALQQIVQEDRIDYLHGALGPIHYFTTRSREPRIKKYLEMLVEALCKRAVETKDGSWFRNFIIDPEEKERIDTGLSHGNAGFLLLLLNVWEAGICKEKIRTLVASGIQFLLSHQIETDIATAQYASFPFSIHSENRDDKYYTQRLAWCYGDLNIVLLLYRAAGLLQKPRWKQMADELADKTFFRKDETSTLATDSHFCHGTAGLAQLYRKLFFLTKNEKFAAAADYWIAQTLQYIDAEWKENKYMDKECDLLNGLPGINLVLVSFITQKELAWSRSLLV